MTYKAYIDNIKAKTGKDPEYFRALAKEKGLAKHGELLAWLKYRTAGWDMVTPTRSFFTSRILNSPKRRSGRMQGRKKPRSNG